MSQLEEDYWEKLLLQLLDGKWDKNFTDDFRELSCIKINGDLTTDQEAIWKEATKNHPQRNEFDDIYNEMEREQVLHRGIYFQMRDAIKKRYAQLKCLLLDENLKDSELSEIKLLEEKFPAYTIAAAAIGSLAHSAIAPENELTEEATHSARHTAVTKKSFPELTEECIEFVNSTDFNNFFDKDHKPLNNKKNKVSLNTMHTTLTNQGHGDLLNEILPNYKADKIDYRYFEEIQEFIFKNIKLYVKNSDDDKLVKCFHAIQFWGGKMDKSIYVMSDGFNSNFDINDYKRLFSLCAEPNKNEIIKYCKYFGPAFITKHINFFTKYLHGNKKPHLIMPIFSPEICNLMFGGISLMKYISHYYEYLHRLCEIKKCTPELMENVFFNRANYSTV